jgi:phage terminase large subunit-like protein
MKEVKVVMEHLLEYMDMVLTESNHPMCKEQKQLIKMIQRILESESDNLYIDEDKVAKYLSYQKYFPFELLPWEKFILVLMLGLYKKDTDSPRFNTLFCMIGRGSGKNAFISYLVFCLTTETNGVPNYNIDIIANSELQAKTSFNDLYNVLNNPKFIDKFKKNFHWNREVITNKKTNSQLRFKTSNAKSADGLRPGAIIFDEVHQYQNWDNINVHKTGLGKVKDGREFYITTNGEVRDSVLDELLNKSLEILNGTMEDFGHLPFICRLDDKEEVHNECNWYKANPSLYKMPNLLTQMKKEYQDYKLNPVINKSFIDKRMNLPQMFSVASITDYENIKATNQEIPYEDIKGLYCTVGIDFATISDMVGVAICVKKNTKTYIISNAWMNKNSKDLPKIKAPLKEWAEMGLLTFTSGVENDIGEIFKWIQDTTEKYELIIDGIALDFYRLSVMKRAMEAFNFDYDDKEFTKLIRPSDIMLTVPIIDSLFNNQKLIVGDNPLWRWSANNTQLVPAKHGNFVYDKIDAFRRKNDLFMATVHAIAISDRLTDWDEVDNFLPFL